MIKNLTCIINYDYFSKVTLMLTYFYLIEFPFEILNVRDLHVFIQKMIYLKYIKNKIIVNSHRLCVILAKNI